MPNHYFRFKQFTIQQEKCSMKVCTDACLFGAWIAGKVERGEVLMNRALDIGTGTGLLSLLLAQKTTGIIDALEIEPGAVEQAGENFVDSPWKERVSAMHADARTYKGKEKYDLIISNPPFFENDLLSPSGGNNLAKHNAGLTLSDLLLTVNNNLAADGCFAVLLPYGRSAWFEQLSGENGFHLIEKLTVKQTPSHQPFRSFLLLSRTKRDTFHDTITIKDETGNYTTAFSELLMDYYLQF